MPRERENFHAMKQQGICDFAAVTLAVLQLLRTAFLGRDLLYPHSLNRAPLLGSY